MTSLASLDFLPYLDETGQIPTDPFEGKVGVYAVFDEAQILQYIGVSRNVYTSLREHLVRRPQACYWVKLQTIGRPSRTLLEEIREAWIQENGSVPMGNAQDETLWNEAIDAKRYMTEEERAEIEAADEGTKMKRLKDLARRVETEIMAALEARGVQMPLRFDPKLKEKGLLTLK
jgi:hypothetical protein